MKTNIILEKSYGFSLRIIKLYKYFKERNEHTLATQNFKARLDIAYRKARETRYWLRLLKDSDMIETNLANSFITHCEELLKIIGAIQYTFKQRHFPSLLPTAPSIRNYAHS